MQLFCRARNRLTCRKHKGLTHNPFQAIRSHPMAAATPWERTRSQEPYCPYKPSYMSVYLYALYLSTLFRYKFLRIKTSPRTVMMMMMAMEEPPRLVFIARLVCFCIIELREFCERYIFLFRWDCLGFGLFAWIIALFIMMNVVQILVKLWFSGGVEIVWFVDKIDLSFVTVILISYYENEMADKDRSI